MMVAAPSLAADKDQVICKGICKFICERRSAPQVGGTHFRLRRLRDDTRADLPGYWDAVVLFSMFTTWTRRFTSASGWLGSFSLVLP